MANRSSQRLSASLICLPLIASIALIGCKRAISKPDDGEQWNATYTAAECSALMQKDAFAKRCGNGSLERAIQLANSDIAKCMPFSKPMRMTGLWENALELSAFYPDAQALSDISGKKSRTWFETLVRDRKAMAASQGAGRLVYRVEFVGRKSLCEGHYGNGLFPNEVIADRFLTKTPLKPTAR